MQTQQNQQFKTLNALGRRMNLTQLLFRRSVTSLIIFSRRAKEGPQKETTTNECVRVTAVDYEFRRQNHTDAIWDDSHGPTAIQLKRMPALTIRIHTHTTRLRFKRHRRWCWRNGMCRYYYWNERIDALLAYQPYVLQKLISVFRDSESQLINWNGVPVRSISDCGNDGCGLWASGGFGLLFISFRMWFH